MILDTNAISALAGGDPDISRLIGESKSAVISFIAIAEFKFGLLGSTRPESGEALLRSLVQILPVLSPTSETLSHYADIIWTAALALQFNTPVLSRDRHFDFVEGVDRIDWEPSR
jgi:predicted nucleic acid-binding protein